jgi:DNA-binding phage protein
MESVKTALSDSWQDALIESLKNPEKAAGYLEAVLAEKGPEMELLLTAIKDIVDARIRMNNLSSEAKQQYEQLEKILIKTGGAEVYSFVSLLDTLGFSLVVTPKD